MIWYLKNVGLSSSWEKENKQKCVTWEIWFIFHRFHKCFNWLDINTIKNMNFFVVNSIIKFFQTTQNKWSCRPQVMSFHFFFLCIQILGRIFKFQCLIFIYFLHLFSIVSSHAPTDHYSFISQMCFAFEIDHCCTCFFSLV